MEVIFLGSGNAFYSENMDMSSLLIRLDDFDILVDCGPGCLKNYLKYAGKLHKLKYIFLTHFHGDHTGGLPFLLLYLGHFHQDLPKPVIIGPRGAKNRIRKLCDACYQGSRLIKGLAFREIGKRHLEQRLFVGQNVEFRTYAMAHKKESLAYRITIGDISMAITGDTGWNSKIVEMSEGCELLISECSTLTPETPGHLSVSEWLAKIDLLKAKLIVPVHRGKDVRGALEKEGRLPVKILQDGDKLVF
ncbi:MAG: ribonuclease Z [Spirochaetales bacterium]|nr:ribonuclease Z [Spirochaetales bacterium]